MTKQLINVKNYCFSGIKFTVMSKKSLTLERVSHTKKRIYKNEIYNTVKCSEWSGSSRKSEPRYNLHEKSHCIRCLNFISILYCTIKRFSIVINMYRLKKWKPPRIHHSSTWIWNARIHPWNRTKSSHRTNEAIFCPIRVNFCRFDLLDGISSTYYYRYVYTDVIWRRLGVHAQKRHANTGRRVKTFVL